MTRFFYLLLLATFALCALPNRTLAESDEPAKWSARVLAYSGGAGSAVGIHRALGELWDLGLQVRIDVADHDEKTTGANERDYERVFSDFSITPELRRRSNDVDGLSTYWGALCTYRYRRSEYTRTYEGYLSRQDNRATNLSAGASFGVIVKLHDHLGVSMDLIPIQLGYTWDEREEQTERNDVPEADVADGFSFDLDIDFRPSLYVVVTF